MIMLHISSTLVPFYLIKYGIGYKPISYHDIREKLLKRAVDRTNTMIDKFKA